MEVSRNPPLIDQKYTYAFLRCSYFVGSLLALFDAVSSYVSLRYYTIYKSGIDIVVVNSVASHDLVFKLECTLP